MRKHHPSHASTTALQWPFATPTTIRVALPQFMIQEVLCPVSTPSSDQFGWEYCPMTVTRDEQPLAPQMLYRDGQLQGSGHPRVPD